MPIEEAKNDVIVFLKENAIWLALVIVGVIIITIFFILFLNRKKKQKDDIDVFSLLGGKENISSFDIKGSRVNLLLLDEQKLQEEVLKTSGVNSIIKMSNKIVLVCNKDSNILKSFQKISK